VFANKVLLLVGVVQSVKATNYLSTCIDKYPGYEGDIDASDGSKVIVKFDGKDMTFKFKAKGLEPNCVNCGVHIHTGTTCDDADLVGGHYWDADTVPDPWVTDFSSFYNTDGEGMDKSTFIVNSGYDLEENLGHAVVVHAQDGTRVGCGVLSKTRSGARSCKAEKTNLQACISKYPGYEGDLDISGKVRLRYVHEYLHFRYRLRGAETDCTYCGIHIHTGTTCDDDALVGGHYWDATVSDPWTTAGGAIYQTNSDGLGLGTFSLNAGFDAEENIGHAVVVHDKTGARYGCGVLSTEITNCSA